MKHVLAIGDLGDTTSTPPATPAAPRKAAGPAVWVQQSDGSWAIKWRNNDTWWDLSARYLQSGPRYKEIFNYQSDAFHARVPQPIAIYTGALVAMPPEAVKRAQLLGEAPGGGGVQPSPGPGPVTPGPGPSPSPSGGGGNVTPSPSGGGGNVTPVPGPSGGGGLPPNPGPTPGGGGGGITPRPSGGGGGPIVLPSGQLAASSGTSHLYWWLLGGLGLAVLTTIGVVVYHHSSQREQLEGHHGGRRA